MFINLINHSFYSMMNATITIDELIEYAVKNKQKYVALVDINVMFGMIEFYQKAQKNNLTPIIGLQIDYEGHIYVLIAKNNIGLRNIQHISSSISTREKFIIEEYLKNVYVISLDDSINANICKSCEKYYTLKAINPIAAKENYCMNEDDLIILKTIRAIKNDLTLNDIRDVPTNISFMTETQAVQIYSEDALKNLDELISSVDIKINLNRNINFVKYSDKDPKTTLATLVNEGISRRLNNTIVPQVYRERIEMELDVINKMGFNDYFLVVQDYVNWAKTNDIIVGPGRGSAAGSLVAYSLNITDVDPIKNNLLFERFLNIERKTMPDIDIDFEDTRRNEVVTYLLKKYTGQKVAHIIIFQRLKAKMALRDVGRVLGIDNKIIGLICKMFILAYDEQIDLAINSDKNIKEYSLKYPELFKIVKKIIGFPRNIGIHAAGIVITEDGLVNDVPIIKNEEHICTQFSMEYLESLGLVKVDILGLTTLSVLNNILLSIKVNDKKILKLAEIPLEDTKVFKALSMGDTVGIFQLGSPGMRRVIKRVVPRNIEDVSIVLSLYRPGPIQYIDTFITNRRNPEKVIYLDEKFKPILGNTSGIIVYQEQLMQIIRVAANYTFAQADIFRRIISKKKNEELNKLKEQFINDTIKNGFSNTHALEIYKYIEAFANYGFNHSHALAYSYISYWIMYLRVYFPLSYWTVLLSNAGSQDSVKEYVIDANNHGITVKPPSIHQSIANFSIKNNCIYFGLAAIKGIGFNTAVAIEEIAEKYKNVDVINLIMLLSKNKIDQSTIALLIQAGCFDEMLIDKTRFYLLVNLPELVKKAISILPNGMLIIKPVLVDKTPTKEDLTVLDEQFHKLLGI
ncbi:MAG: DNA polymerase III subunit alpha [Mycoplasmataceae bacterium]|nr:DNA polymerase III subunit alpha [Mycoplasmataceae bacterium]